ncbi:ribonuclease H-like domain-containing protein [Tanacetum coccineum]|uniref:Ribonuclease H-like domain-containing protein n=1 Tax=Tanacetum coccineum TaxID=301880 RepID=A0ABQ5G464_9ASTR
MLIGRGLPLYTHVYFRLLCFSPVRNFCLGLLNATHPCSRSSAEVEYRGVANIVAEIVWLRNLLHELHSPLSTATLVYCDNVSAVYMSVYPVQHQRTKHIAIDIHFVRDMVTAGQVGVLHIPSRYQYADIFTKGLPLALFEEFCHALEEGHGPEHKLVKKFLTSLPRRFVHIVAALEKVLDLKTTGFEDVVGRLKAYEERVKEEDKANDPQENLLYARTEYSNGIMTQAKEEDVTHTLEVVDEVEVKDVVGETRKTKVNVTPRKTMKIMNKRVNNMRNMTSHKYSVTVVIEY